MGFGLGAENVVGYATMTEFVPARSRGKWSGFTTVCVVTGLPISLLVASLIIPQFGWRAMFVLGGIGALIVWYLRKALPESPRWLEANGRSEEAEALMQSIEREASQGQPLPAPAAAPAVTVSSDLATLFAPPLLSRMIVGAVCLITINTLLYGFITWLPVFFIKQGLERRDVLWLFAADGARRARRLGDRRADRRQMGPQADHHRRLADFGRARDHLSHDLGPGVAAGRRLRADGADLCAGGAAVRHLHPRTVPDRSTACARPASSTRSAAAPPS